MAEGYVIFAPAESLYCQGDITYYDPTDEQWMTTTLWAPWMACAKVFETQEDAMKHCPDLAMVIKVNAETMEVIE